MDPMLERYRLRCAHAVPGLNPDWSLPVASWECLKGVLDVLDGSATVLELGAGSSSYLFAPWLARTGGTWIQGEHDPGFGQLIVRWLIQDGLEISTWTDRVGPALSMGPFDLVLVDHGPTFHSRLEDIPAIWSVLKPGGVALFDDWRRTMASEGTVRLNALGAEPEVVVTGSRPMARVTKPR